MKYEIETNDQGEIISVRKIKDPIKVVARGEKCNLTYCNKNINGRCLYSMIQYDCIRYKTTTF